VRISVIFSISASEQDERFADLVSKIGLFDAEVAIRAQLISDKSYEREPNRVLWLRSRCPRDQELGQHVQDILESLESANAEVLVEICRDYGSHLSFRIESSDAVGIHFSNEQLRRLAALNCVVDGEVVT